MNEEPDQRRRNQRIKLLVMLVIFAPIAAWLSILFPKDADLATLGRDGNPHQLAALLGTLALQALAMLLLTRVIHDVIVIENFHRAIEIEIRDEWWLIV